MIVKSRYFFAAVLSMLICSCGGGGSGSPPVPSQPQPPPAPISISPSPWVLTISPPGLSAMLSVNITVTNASAFNGVSTLYVMIVDSQKVLTGGVTLTQTDSLHYSAMVNTSPNLAVGRYQGTFQVELCKDAACATQIAGSPVPLAYDWTIDNSSFGLGVSGSTTAVMTLGGPPPPDWQFTANTGLAWTASADVPWLQVNNGSGTGNSNFSVSVVPTGLAVGTYTGNVTLTLSDMRSISQTLTLIINP